MKKPGGEAAAPLQLELTVEQEGVTAIDLLAEASGLPRARLKDAMNKGAVWRRTVRGGRLRLRRATTRLKAGDRIGLHYDPDLLRRSPPPAACVLDRGRYSVWDKPAGLMTQGNDYGDHCSLLRQVERHFAPPRQVFPVHRLDREAAGLVVVAHDRGAAGQLSALMQGRAVYKRYRVEVRGDLSGRPEGAIDIPLDGKPALSRYRLREYDAGRDVSRLDVEIETGRRHQIRRHLERIGHPVMGDPRYGSGNADARGMQLQAVELRFMCPVQRREVRVSLDASSE